MIWLLVVTPIKRSVVGRATVGTGFLHERRRRMLTLAVNSNI